MYKCRCNHLLLINRSNLKKLTSGILLLLIVLFSSAQQKSAYFNDARNSLDRKQFEVEIAKGDNLLLNENNSFAETVVSSEVCQTLNLKSGWNIFSVPNHPEPASVQSVFQTLIDDGSLLKIQDELGNTLEDWGVLGGWRNKIGDVAPAEGYMIQLDADRTLQVCGQSVSYPFGIPLKKGWNIIGYPNANPVDAIKVMQELISNNTLTKVEDENGNSLEYNNGWQNQIGNFTPGEGYRIRVTDPTTLWIYENYETVTEPDYELQVRSGLPNFFRKVKNNESVDVVYFGGSITYAEGWRPQTANWMREYFNNSNINDFNASIGGTSSEFGAYRLGRDVLPHNPDLVLVEFAVNDAGRDYTEIIRSMEGIVRQIKNADSNTELCFVYTIKTSTLNYLPPDNLQQAVQAMEEVAEHYQIPSIHFGPEVKQRVDNDELIFEGSSTYINGIPVFSMDGVHPYPETGHVVYTEVFKRSIKTLEVSNVNSKVYPAPLRSDNLVKAKMVMLSEVQMASNWENLSADNFPDYPKFEDRVSGAMFTNTTGDYIEFRFRGTHFGVTDIIGPRSGYVDVTIDGSASYSARRFDAYCRYYRIHFFLREISDGEHNIKLSLSSRTINKRDILYDKAAYDRDPDAFSGLEWYPIQVLINGDLILQ